jgi:simple sugar transport system permease protein
MRRRRRHLKPRSRRRSSHERRIHHTGTLRRARGSRRGVHTESRCGLGACLGRSQSLIPTLAAVALFIGMLVYAEIAYGRVFHLGTMSSLLVSFAPTIILAVAMTVVILSGGIDLSVGAVVAFTSVAGVMLMDIGVNGWLAIVLMIAFGALFGLVSGVLVQYFNVQPFIATLAMMFLARGLASMLSTVPVHAPTTRRSICWRPTSS